MLSDLLKSLQQQANLTDDAVLRLEDSLRRQWGGERVYVSKTPLMRDSLIRGALLQGLPVDRVALKLGVSTRTVYRVKARVGKPF